MPHLVTTSQEMESRDSDDVLATVLLHQATLDLTDLWSHGATKREAPGVVDVQSNDGPGLRDRPTGGLQGVAAHQKDGRSRDTKTRQ